MVPAGSRWSEAMSDAILRDVRMLQMCCQGFTLHDLISIMLYAEIAKNN